MWEYNPKDDSTRAIRGGYYEGRSLRDMLTLMFKGRATDFPNEPRDLKFSAYKPMPVVSARTPLCFWPLTSSACSDLTSPFHAGMEELVNPT